MVGWVRKRTAMLCTACFLGGNRLLTHGSAPSGCWLMGAATVATLACGRGLLLCLLWHFTYFEESPEVMGYRGGLSQRFPLRSCLDGDACLFVQQRKGDAMGRASCSDASEEISVHSQPRELL